MDHRARLGAALALGVLAGCKSDRPSAEPAASATAEKSAPKVVTVTAADFSFDAQAQIPAGATTFRLVNTGTELHQAQLIKLEDGKTLDDLGKAMQSPGPPLSWMRFLGGPNRRPGQGWPRNLRGGSQAGRLRSDLLRSRCQGREAASGARDDEEPQGELTHFPRRKSAGVHSNPRSAQRPATCARASFCACLKRSAYLMFGGTV